jgi:hypothetical protein
MGGHGSARPDRRENMRQQSKKSIQGKKLSLSKETLRQLNENDLLGVAGGEKTKHCPGTAGPTANCSSPC